MNTSEYVFVEFYVMLGDADGSIKGNKVILRSEWDKMRSAFVRYLENSEHAEWGYISRDHDHFGEYQITLKCWTVMPCTAEEKAVLDKFFSGYNPCPVPTDYIECDCDDESDE